MFDDGSHPLGAHMPISSPTIDAAQRRQLGLIRQEVQDEQADRGIEQWLVASSSTVPWTNVTR